MAVPVRPGVRRLVKACPVSSRQSSQVIGLVMLWRGSLGVAGLVRACRGTARQQWLALSSRVLLGHVAAATSSHEGPAVVGLVMLCHGRFGLACRGGAWIVSSRLPWFGEARHGPSSLGSERQENERGGTIEKTRNQKVSLPTLGQRFCHVTEKNSVATLCGTIDDRTIECEQACIAEDGPICRTCGLPNCPVCDVQQRCDCDGCRARFN